VSIYLQEIKLEYKIYGYSIHTFAINVWKMTILVKCTF